MWGSQLDVPGINLPTDTSLEVSFLSLQEEIIVLSKKKEIGSCVWYFFFKKRIKPIIYSYGSGIQNIELTSILIVGHNILSKFQRNALIQEA